MYSQPASLIGRERRRKKRSSPTAQTADRLDLAVCTRFQALPTRDGAPNAITHLAYQLANHLTVRADLDRLAAAIEESCRRIDPELVIQRRHQILRP
jgi:hypothetical protein